MRRFISLRCATRNECFRFAGHTYEFLSTRSVIMKLTFDISGWAEMLWIWINVSVILFLCLRSGWLRLSKGMVVVVRIDYKWEGIFFLNELVYCMNWHHSFPLQHRANIMKNRVADVLFFRLRRNGSNNLFDSLLVTWHILFG